MDYQPNILLIVTDDHGQWACGPYGNQEVITPYLDYLATSGVVMESAFTPIPVLFPGTSLFADRADGLATRSPRLHCGVVRPGPWLATERTLPQLLQSAGYRTGLAGKWHVENEDSPAPGFDSWFSVGSAYPLLHEGAREFCNQGRMETLRGFTDDIIGDETVEFVSAVDERLSFCHTTLRKGCILYYPDDDLVNDDCGHTSSGTRRP